MSLSALDELFVNVGEAARLNVLDQNRLGGAVGLALRPQVTLEVGYQLQTILKGRLAEETGRQLMEQNHTLTVGVVTKLDVGGAPGR